VEVRVCAAVPVAGDGPDRKPSLPRLEGQELEVMSESAGGRVGAGRPSPMETGRGVSFGGPRETIPHGPAMVQKWPDRRSDYSRGG